MQSVLVVGAGVFGLSSALALRARGFSVTVVDPGPVPHPLAASTDISKAVRADYGRDDFYTDWMLEALPRWRAWNARWTRPLFHETGVSFLSGSLPKEGGFEYESAQRLLARGIALELLNEESITRRFPQWKPGRFLSGYFNPVGGWAEAGEVVAALARDAQAEGVLLRGDTPVLGIHDDGAGIDTPQGALRADSVVVSVGAWTPRLVPELLPALRSTAQTVFLLRPVDPTPFLAPRHVMFGADISVTGWYGFPLHPTGLLKIAHHGDGWSLDPDAPRIAPAHFVERFRDFLSRDLPSLVDAPLVETRVCLYCDSFDGDFWIDRSPSRPALIVSAGGSGHGFKFAPVIGDVVSAILTDEPHPARDRFRWRLSRTASSGKEDARALGTLGTPQ